MITNNSPFFDIELEELLDFNKINELYIRFINCDIRNREELNLDDNEKFYIEYFEIDFENLTENELEHSDFASQKLTTKNIKINFFENCLIPAILRITPKEIGKIEIRRKNENKYSNEEKLGYYNEIVVELEEKLKRVQNIQYLDINIKQLIENEVIWVIRDYIADRTLELDSIKKIPFANMSTENLAFLFSRFLDNNYILTTPGDLGVLISKYFSINSKPIDSSFRNKLSRYSKRTNWNVTNTEKLNTILDKLTAISK